MLQISVKLEGGTSFLVDTLSFDGQWRWCFSSLVVVGLFLNILTGFPSSEGDSLDLVSDPLQSGDTLSWWSLNLRLFRNGSKRTSQPRFPEFHKLSHFSESVNPVSAVKSFLFWQRETTNRYHYVNRPWLNRHCSTFSTAFGSMHRFEPVAIILILCRLEKPISCFVFLQLIKRWNLAVLSFQHLPLSFLPFPASAVSSRRRCACSPLSVTSPSSSRRTAAGRALPW